MMHAAPLPLTRDLLLIGGGHAHALLLRQWGMNPLPGVRVTVINPEPSAPYTGMLPGFVAGHYPREALQIDLQRLARFAGARLILGLATGIDRVARTVTVGGRGAVPYDVASLDIGIHSDMPTLAGFTAHGTAAKPLERFANLWASHLDALRARPDLAARGMAVIGAGVAGVELALAMRHGAEQAAGRRGPLYLVDSGAALQGIGAGAARALRRALTKQDVTLVEHATVTGLEDSALTLGDGRRLLTAFTVGAAGARPHGWLADTGLVLSDGFVRVKDTLQCIDDPDFFAVGDCAHMDHAPRPKAGVFPVRQAPILFQNLRAALGAGSMRAYHPQRAYLKLISLGGKRALAARAGLKLQGGALWRWKDHIDRAFMDKLSDLPAMASPPLPRNVADGVREALDGGKPMCGGCGSKLGPSALSEALSRLPARTRTDVQSLAGDDAAVLTMGDGVQVLSTDHLRAFTEDPLLMARITANHALGDVFAMGAAPQAALMTVILPRGNERMHGRIMADVIDGAAPVFAEAGAEITGGHTMIGDALSLGFTVTGTAQRAITLAGAQAGDAVILTGALGTGTILAAEMTLAARGEWVAGAWAQMARSQRAAAEILADAHAMTDVTGFGLAGHLMAILRASGLAGVLDLDAVPLLAGAVELAAAGHRSTLWPANRQALADTELPDDPRATLLFDPQTAGGLLAAVPAEKADDLVERLRAAGYPAARIATLSVGAPTLSVR